MVKSFEKFSQSLVVKIRQLLKWGTIAKILHLQNCVMHVGTI